MKNEEIDKKIGMPDIDAEWTKFEQDVIEGKSHSKLSFLKNSSMTRKVAAILIIALCLGGLVVASGLHEKSLNEIMVDGKQTTAIELVFFHSNDINNNTIYTAIDADTNVILRIFVVDDPKQDTNKQVAFEYYDSDEMYWDGTMTYSNRGSDCTIAFNGTMENGKGITFHYQGPLSNDNSYLKEPLPTR